MKSLNLPLNGNKILTVMPVKNDAEIVEFALIIDGSKVGTLSADFAVVLGDFLLHGNPPRTPDFIAEA